jgi:hypothetical protein
MIKKWIPPLLLSLVLLSGCALAKSSQDGARAPAARPDSLTAGGSTIYPGEFSQVTQVRFHPDGKVTVQEEFTGTQQFATWLTKYQDAIAQAVSGELKKVEEGERTRFVSQTEFDSVAALNGAGRMEATVSNSPLFYTLQVKTATSAYTATKLAQVFDRPEGQLSDEEWGTYLLDAFHLRYEVKDERTGAEFNWERSAREIGSGQDLLFNSKVWRPLAWAVLGVSGALLLFVTWAGFFGERVWAPQVE